MTHYDRNPAQKSGQFPKVVDWRDRAILYAAQTKLIKSGYGIKLWRDTIREEREHRVGLINFLVAKKACSVKADLVVSRSKTVQFVSPHLNAGN